MPVRTNESQMSRNSLDMVVGSRIQLTPDIDRLPEILKIHATGEKETPHGVGVKKTENVGTSMKPDLTELLKPKNTNAFNLDEHVNIKIMTSGGQIAGEAKVMTPDKLRAIRDKKGGNQTPSFLAALYPNHLPDDSKSKDSINNKISVNYMGK